MTIIDSFNMKLRGPLEHWFFKTIIGALIFANPVALAPQTWVAFTAPSVDGISLLMIGMFTIIQTAVIFEGIRMRSAPMFWSMLLSVPQGITIIIVVWIRG